MELLGQVEGLVDSLYWCTVRKEPEQRLAALLQLREAVACEGLLLTRRCLLQSCFVPASREEDTTPSTLISRPSPAP
jgi:hypothetical protein